MANNSVFARVQDLLSHVGENSFQAQCLKNLGRNTSNYADWSNVSMVGEHGEHLTEFSDAVWGITYDSCRQICGLGQLNFPFDYDTFANSMTNYLLPWLALTAQLPYETGDPYSNVMAFCMAVGSPVLVTYSLTLTILNRSWARKYFKKLKDKASEPIVRKRAPDFDKRVDSAQFLLQEAQQVPLRCSQERDWLASLIVLPQNSDWWEHLEDRLRGTRRGFSPSLIAQMGLAIIAWLLTVLSAFHALLGDPSTALQIASSSLWTWLVPVIIGWILVGSQMTDHSIEDGLKASAYVARARPPDVQELSPPFQQRRGTLGEIDTYVERGNQRGIECRGGLSPQHYVINRHKVIHRDSIISGGSTMRTSARPDLDHESQTQVDLRVKGWLGFEIGGDEEIKGPTYNYARVFTWWQVVHTISASLDTTVTKISQGRPCEPETKDKSTSQQPLPASHIGEMDFQAFANTISQYCGLADEGSCKQYPEWKDITADVFKRIIAAALISIFVQWGTAGDSIMTAYLTPTVGLGCRSGSYLIYASTSTLAWLCLLLATLFSHQAMLQYQRHILDRDGTGFRPSSIVQGDANPGEYIRPMSHTLTCAAAVIFRLLGKTLCIANTLWLLLSSMMEYLGGFDNCWCMGIENRSMNGYVVIFKDSKDLATASATSWTGGLVFVVVVVAIAIVIFSMGTWKPDD